MTKLERYIWLIKLFQEKPSVTFEEIYKEWHKTRKKEIIPILKDNYGNLIQHIQKMFGIQKDGVLYKNWHIAYSERDFLSKKELHSVFDMLNEIAWEIIHSKSSCKSLILVNKYDLIYEDIVMKVLCAMNTKRKILLKTIISLNSRDRYEVLTVAPYQLHFINHRWYMIGQTDEFGLMRIPLLYYYGEACITDNTYSYPADYSQEAYCKMIYGTTNDRQHLTLRIQDNVLEKTDFSIFPLMPFLQKIENGNWDKEGIIRSRHNKSLVRLQLDMPITPFALYTLKSALNRMNYKIESDKDPFSLFTAKQYNMSTLEPVVL